MRWSCGWRNVSQGILYVLKCLQPLFSFLYVLKCLQPLFSFLYVLKCWNHCFHFFTSWNVGTTVFISLRLEMFEHFYIYLLTSLEPLFHFFTCWLYVLKCVQTSWGCVSASYPQEGELICTISPITGMGYWPGEAEACLGMIYNVYISSLVFHSLTIVNHCDSLSHTENTLTRFWVVRGSKSTVVFSRQKYKIVRSTVAIEVRCSTYSHWIFTFARIVSV